MPRQIHQQERELERPPRRLDGLRILPLHHAKASARSGSHRPVCDAKRGPDTYGSAKEWMPFSIRVGGDLGSV